LSPKPASGTWPFWASVHGPTDPSVRVGTPAPRVRRTAGDRAGWIKLRVGCFRQGSNMRFNVRRRVLLLTLPVMLLASSASVFVSIGAASAGTQTVTAGQLKSGRLCLPPSAILKSSKPLCFPMSPWLPAQVKAESNGTPVRCVISGFYLAYQGVVLYVTIGESVDEASQAWDIFSTECHI